MFTDDRIFCVENITDSKSLRTNKVILSGYKTGVSDTMPTLFLHPHNEQPTTESKKAIADMISSKQSKIPSNKLNEGHKRLEHGRLQNADDRNQRKQTHKKSGKKHSDSWSRDLKLLKCSRPLNVIYRFNSGKKKCPETHEIAKCLNDLREVTLSDFKPYYKATATKKV